MTENRETLRASLLKELDPAKIPAHIGIIMDGNGRWAKSRGKSRIRGHQEGARRVKTVVRFANDLGVKHISLYAFSVENWARPSFEVSALMRLIRAYIIRERNDLHAEGVKFRLLGRLEELAPEIVRQAQISTELMQNNPGLSLNLCINYGGRAEIVDAVKKIINKGYKADQITEELIAANLYWPELPDVDLMVRTSGEMRTSNFHLWRGAYSELYFTPVLWPDFDDVELLKALLAYQNRERRFGMISEQLAKN
ncbi:MAG TPA: polyprenyl diphosphate synthase [Candidatus Rifleibacterium sp.]|jgi:undecaprenyl diphosphate synthase|nr:polyprenyl diphosphate synthase [Candidatus Rifleibacterium sp.]HPW57343.1 polyprenyl diphosphate synthase [Candidatus Rifleibacterium sp.]HQB83848.1 polyprenyl diphosphate synthase [Candidatus Rifleibacterium sp.]